MEWLILDGNGPFFRDCPDKRVNWSKAPFAHVRRSGMLEGESARRLVGDFARIADAAREAGFNALTLDDLGHMIEWSGYPLLLRQVLAQYRCLYEELMEVAAARGLRVLATTDVMFSCPALTATCSGFDATLVWLRERLDALFSQQPLLAGVVFRVGESDAIGTSGEFRSRLLIRTPRQARRFIRALLPVFDRHDRTFFFRTWTVGAYAIGDLIWHRRTFRQVFAGITSRNLVISMKYGESDFFRYLPLNRHFFRTGLKTLVEFQARREYEGFGEYPAFVGWEYETYLRRLATAPNLVGASVWCQTGGWGRFKRLTYVHRSSVWVELNTFVTAALCRGMSCETAVREFCSRRLPQADSDAFLVFLALADDVIADLLYVREFAEQKFFFRRLRVPPLLFTYWDRCFVNSMVRSALRHLVKNHERCIDEGRAALRKLGLMRELAYRHQLPSDGLDFQFDTFEILLALREFIFGNEDEQAISRLTGLAERYRETWNPRYAMKFDFGKGRLPGFRFEWGKRILLRQQRGYRIVDSMITLRLLSCLYPLLKPWRRHVVPKFALRQAMGVDALFT